MNYPEVSIIIPSFNSWATLRYALRNVIKQSYGKFECILIDNNSTDNTKYEYKKEYIDKDKRFKYYEIENQGIISKSRNLGIKKSKGKWIAFLDSDDLWHRKIRILYKIS